MTPLDHLELVVRPNMQAMRDDVADIRHAFNAIAAVDSLAAHIYWWAVHNKPGYVAEPDDDTGFRKRLVERDKDFRLVFDIAKASKHVRLMRGDPSVRAADQLVAKHPGWGEWRWDDFRWDIEQVRIEPIGATAWSAEGVLDRALAFLEKVMVEAGIMSPAGTPLAQPSEKTSAKA
jgi:hypothetical protein